MKKITTWLASFVISVTVLIGFSPNVRAVDVNNFTINSYAIDYYLSKDSEGRSQLRTVEKIEAEFPDYDQNHGIERALPTRYDGHSVSLKVISVTDADGKELPYSTNGVNGNDVLQIGDGDAYVHGKQNYVITYTQRDTTRYFADTKSDEFYWDTNGTEWAVPIKLLNISLYLDGDLPTKLSGNQQCYVGAAGSSAPCSLVEDGDGFSIQAENLSPGENVTLAVGFEPQTFNAYQMSIIDKLIAAWFVALAITFVVAFVLMIIFTIRFVRKSNRRGELGTIIPEYIPPKEAGIPVAASIYNREQSAFSALLIDLAVRHYLKIYQIREKSLFKQAQYELEIIRDISDLPAEEQEIVRDIFPSTAVGTRLNMDDMKKDRTAIYVSLSDNKKKLDTSIRGAYGLRAKDPTQSAWFKRVSGIVLFLAIITLSPFLLVASIVGYVCAYMLWPLTDKGLGLYRYLEGLKMYIKTAEADRLKMLQSPEGAAKVGAPVDTNDTRQLVKLYERVLPYAILFGQEKEWNNRLGQYYESMNTAPDWYVGNNAVFNAAVLSSAIGNFNTVATYSNPTSSSSGGSGGGGFSGGGGGGGGGGGW